MSFEIRRVSDPEPRSWCVLSKKCLMDLLVVGRPLFHWYWDYKHRKEHEKRIGLLKRIFLLLLALLLALLVFSSLTKSILSLRLLGFHSLLNFSGEPPPVDSYGHTNILLFGQGDETGEDLTDSIMLVSVDPMSQSVVLLSLPRDLYLLKPDRLKPGKLNSRYRDFKHALMSKKDIDEEGASLQSIQELAAEIGRSMNIEIHHVIKVDFEGFVQAIDTIDGIDLDIPYDIVDNEYPGPNYTYEPFEIHAGAHHLDGATTLKYVRSRSTTSDFARSERQQQVLRALLQKVEVHALLNNPTRITRLVKILQHHIQTSASIREAIGIAALALHILPTNIITMQLHDRNGLYGEVLHPGGFLYTPPREFFDGASVLLPISIPEFPISWKQLHTLTTLLFHKRTPYLEHPSFIILNAGAPPGSAARLAHEFIRYGFTVIDTANAPEKRDLSLLLTSDPISYSASFFSTLLTVPTDASAPPGEPLTILLGKDYHYAPFQSLIES